MSESTPAVRRVLMLTHTGRPEAREVALEFCEALTGNGIVVRLPATEAADLGLDPTAYDPCIETTETGGAESLADAACELALVIGGDGTILRAAEVTRDSGIPLLGVNLGHVGFLAEAEVDDVESTIEAIVGAPLHHRGPADPRRAGPLRGRAGLPDLRRQRGQRREVRARADGRGRGRGRRSTSVAVGVRRRRLRHADRIHGLQLQCRRPDRVARSRGPADRAAQRPRALRPTDGRRPDLGAGRGDARPQRRGRRPVVRRATHGRPGARARGSRSAAAPTRSA